MKKLVNESLVNERVNESKVPAQHAREAEMEWEREGLSQKSDEEVMKYLLGRIRMAEQPGRAYGDWE